MGQPLLPGQVCNEDGTGLHIQLWGHGSDCATANAITASGQVERSTEKYKKECPDGFL